MSATAEVAGHDLYAYERALVSGGFSPVAGADEAGRGACAGPLVAAAVVLDDTAGAEIPGLRDSKLMTPRQRDVAYDVIREQAVAWAVVEIPPQVCDRRGLQRANLEALRRALLRLDVPVRYCLTDGFAVDGLGVPGLALWKGDRVAACVAAASVLAKVTRDRIMVTMEETHPGYGFAQHKGYTTPAHQDALERLGPCPQHRMSYDNVIRAARLTPR